MFKYLFRINHSIALFIYLFYTISPSYLGSTSTFPQCIHFSWTKIMYIEKETMGQVGWVALGWEGAR